MRLHVALAPLLTLMVAVSLVGCGEKKEVVVVYTSHDPIYSKPIFDLFEKTFHISVMADFDTEANKSVGMVTKLINESSYPKCDVFWNNQVGRTIQLKKRGILEQIVSTESSFYPKEFVDSHWIGFGARARVLIYNTDLVSKKDLPRSILELTDPKWAGKFAIAYPLFGTTASHFAALYEILGPEKAESFFEGLVRNKVVVAAGNAMVKDMVAEGTVPFGITDTDDAEIARKRGQPVDFYFLDQEENGIGTLVIPNTVSLIKGAPHALNAAKFIDFLLSREVEELLARSQARQIPLRNDASQDGAVVSRKEIRGMAVSYDDIAAGLEKTDKLLQKLFAR